MRRFSLLTVVTGIILLYLTGSVFQTRGQEGKGPLQVSANAFFDTGTIQQLGLQLTSVGGRVVAVGDRRIVVVTKNNRRLQIVYGAQTRILEGSLPVPASAITVASHVAAQALPLGSTYAAIKAIHLLPHYRSIGGEILSTGSLIAVQSRHTGVALLRLLPNAKILVDSSNKRYPFSLRPAMQVIARAYPDPFEAGVYRTGEIRLLATTAQTRVGGTITAIDSKSNLIKVFNKTQHTTYTIEVLSSTKITLSKYTASLGDMAIGDHLTVTGKMDVLHAATLGPNALLAKIIRIGSPSFGGTITAITSVQAGGIRITLKGRHHLLTVDAPARTVVFALVAGTQQNARVLNLAVGQHIAVKGARVGKFEMLATSIHVYPHQHSVSGVAASVLPGFVHLTVSTGGQYIIRLTPVTTYSLNGQKTNPITLRAGLHLRIRGYDSMYNSPNTIPTLIAAHISVTIHIKVVHKKTTSTKKTPTPTPPKKKAVVQPRRSTAFAPVVRIGGVPAPLVTRG